MRLPVQDVYKIGGVGTIVVGRVDSGILRQNMDVIIVPGYHKTEADTIETDKTSIMEGYPGDLIGFKVKSLTDQDIKRGSVCGDPSKDPPRETENFVAQVVIINHPN